VGLVQVGFPTDLNQAQAVVETTWVQAVAGDGGESRGLQTKLTVWGGYPNSADSTAFNADWALGLRRAGYDGVMWYPQLRGSLPACIGGHSSGDPEESTWREYTDAIYENERTKPWFVWPSAAGSPPTDRGVPRAFSLGRVRATRSAKNPAVTSQFRELTGD
jgi:autotransporter family porin